MAAIQRDLFVEVDERLLIKDNPSLKVIADALPQSPILKTWQIVEVLPICQETLHRWCKAYKFDWIDLTAGDKVTRYGIYRKSFLAFLATRVNIIK